MTVRRVLIAAILTILPGGFARAADQGADTRSLIAVLESDATLYEKARACQQLGERGTPEAVPALASLLVDPKLSPYARSGLEGIGGPGATAALVEAAHKVKGPQLAGIVNSLGVLRATEATDFFGRLASDPSSGVVREALMALGNISTPTSIRFLKEALARGPDNSRGEAAAACLLAADRQLRDGELSQAAALYDFIRKAKVPTAYRVGATRGAILARKADRVPFLVKQLRSAEPAIRNAALLTIREVPEDALVTALNKEVAHAAPDFQRQLLLALADCHNAQSIPVIESLARAKNPQMRQTALAVLGRLGPNAAPALLTTLQQDRPADEKSILLNALKTAEGSAVDDLILQALGSAAAPAIQIDLIRLLDSRNVAKAAPAILKFTSASDKKVQLTALAAMGALAGTNEVPALVAVTGSCTDAEIRDAAESALGRVCARCGDAAAEAVFHQLQEARSSSERNCWIRVLSGVGYASALPAIESVAKDSDPEVAGNALEQLGHWPNPAPMETLLKVMESGASPGLRQRALGSVIELATTAADENQTPESIIVSWLGRANSLVESTEHKRRLLGLLGRLNTVESFRLLVPYLEDPAVRTEAASGIVQIAPALAKSENPQGLKTALEKISVTVENADLKSRAIQLLKPTTVPVESTSLFDGHSLAGWEGDTNVWRVREGLIVGGSMNGNPRNEFLATVRSYTNFLLRLEYKLVGTEGFINSGVQFRSVRLSNPPNEMKGYQADIGAGYSGCLYDESRRNSFLAHAGPETIQRLEKTNDWNNYQIRAEGTHIQIWLNGEKTVDYGEAEAGIPQTGLIGLQIHGGNKAEVSFRNITIQEF